MLKKSITYEDPFTGEQQTVDHYFHLSKAEMIELELSVTGGLSKRLQEIVETGDASTIIKTFKDLVLRSYGIKTHEGQFRKSEQISADFETSPAYSALFMELVTDAGAAAEFVNGVVPKGLEQDMAKLQTKNSDEPFVPHGIRGGEEATSAREAFEGKTVDTPPPGTPRVLTRAEAIAMDGAELTHLLSTGQAVIGDTEG